MKKTRLCNLLGIQYPIIQGGMLWLADARLAAAVSSTGALGILSPYAGMDKSGDPLKNLKLQIDRIKDLTDKPFGVNIPLDLRQSGILIDIIIKKNVGIIITAAGNPANYTPLLKLEGIKVLHVASSVRQTVKAESCKVDAVIVEGVEAAGHIGFDELPLFSLIPQAADAVSIPVVAAGGIVDERGVAAAMALGAEGVQMGTRFVAVDECIASQNYKDAIVKAEDTGTVVTSRKLLPTRNLKTAFAKKLLELENKNASADKIREFIGYRRSPDAQLDGKLDQGEVFSGSSVGLIKEVVPVSGVIEKIVKGYKDVIGKL